VYPSTAADAKGLLLAAVREPNPVLYFEHKGLYRSQSDSVPEGWYEIPIGQGRIVQSGHDLTIITYGMGVRWALEACSALPMASIEIVDLRSLQPIDWDLCFESVQRTNKCLVLHEATFSFGIGAELAARIGSECFRYLDAPVMRVGALDTPVPFHAKLETDFMPYARFLVVVSAMLEY
jgi:2-oxoisovalerate dehydrogenase E1 component